MRVLVDVEQDRDVKLRGAVRGQPPQVGPQGQSVQSLKLVSHLHSLSNRQGWPETVTVPAPGNRTVRGREALFVRYKKLLPGHDLPGLKVVELDDVRNHIPWIAVRVDLARDGPQ